MNVSYLLRQVTGTPGVCQWAGGRFYGFDCCDQFLQCQHNALCVNVSVTLGLVVSGSLYWWGLGFSGVGAGGTENGGNFSYSLTTDSFPVASIDCINVPPFTSIIKHSGGCDAPTPNTFVVS